MTCTDFFVLLDSFQGDTVSVLCHYNSKNRTNVTLVRDNNYYYTVHKLGSLYFLFRTLI